MAIVLEEYDNNRLCATLYTKYNMTMVLMNVYMPCNNNCHDDAFINILNDVSLLLYRYNPSHVVFGGDMNVDLRVMLNQLIVICSVI